MYITLNRLWGDIDKKNAFLYLWNLIVIKIKGLKPDDLNDTTVDELNYSGKSTEQIYSELKKVSTNTVSEENVCSPKLIKNWQFAKKKETNGNVLSEAEALIYNVKSINSVLSTVVFFLPHMLSNLKKCCVNGNSVWRVDTTFELVDGLCLTDSTYTNEALINSQKKHPEFPGPSMWHFHKDQKIYRQFAAELVMQDSALWGIKKIGHDLDQMCSVTFS